jgi:hypothetical protein
MSRHDLADDVRGINASLDLIRETLGGAGRPTAVKMPMRSCVLPSRGASAVLVGQRHGDGELPAALPAAPARRPMS